MKIDHIHCYLFLFYPKNWEKAWQEHLANDKLTIRRANVLLSIYQLELLGFSFEPSLMVNWSGYECL